MGWIAQGENERSAIREIIHASDRSTAIVAAALVEARIEQAIKHKLTNRDEKIEAEMFRPSGPLGSFSAKLNLGHLMGLYDRQHYSDLVCLKNIRNRFAHHIEASSFSEEPVRSMTENFQLIKFPTN